MKAHRRHDISDKTWNLLEPHLPGRRGIWGALYKLRHLVENAFLHLKRWRGIATRYAKNTASFLAAVHMRCIAIWAGIS